MPKKQVKEKKKEERNLITRFFLLIVNTLVLLGYIIIHPFEKIYKAFDDLRIKIWKFLNKPIGVEDITQNVSDRMNFINSTAVGLMAWLNVHKQKKKTKKRSKALQKSRIAHRKERQKRRQKKVSKVKLFLMFWLGGIFTLVFFAIPVFAYFWFSTLPSPELLQDQIQNSSTKILDRNGRVLYEIYIDKKYDPVPLKRIPDEVINATLAIEDADFYSHPGFDIRGIARAARSTFLEDRVEGGSTITQQLIKNVLLTPDRTYERKIKELVLAVMVERNYSKSEILEFYLNNIPYGGTAYGIESASQKYFGKSSWDLNLAEASMLAGLPSAPSVYSPLNGNMELAKERQKQVLDRMVSVGYVTPFEAEIAYSQELTLAPQVEYIRAPHFVNYVRESLYSKFGQRAVDFGGLTVRTTLDLDLQEKVQKIVSDEVSENGTRLNFSNGAAIVLDSRTAQILAYVGSVDFFSGDEGNFDVATAYRQPGSSIKPVTYALALEQGYTPLSLIDDKPITYQFSGQKYTPKNYDGKYHGKVTLRQALANSYNIPAVKLVNAVGVDEMVQLGKNMGLDNWVVGDGSYGMSITLGGKETRLLDLTNLYATFSRLGLYREETPFLSIKDIYGYEVSGVVDSTQRQVLSQESSYIITSILSDNAARTPAFGPNSQLYIKDKTVAVKTGTTNDIRDNLTIGYTPTYAVGVWVGNNDNTIMNNNLASGLTGAAPIWNKIMVTLLQDTKDETFTTPEGILKKDSSECANKYEVFNKKFEIPDKICFKQSKNDEKKENN
jgi:1A family penicillin-binding protein